MRATHTQTNFTGGVMSSKMFGRSDLAKYANGAETVENAIIFPQGGASRRSGTRFVSTTRNNNLGRLLSFKFNDAEAYVVEMTGLWFRFYRDGGQIISSVTLAALALDAGTVYTGTVASAHGLAVGDHVAIAGATPAGYNGTYEVIAVPTGTTFKVDIGSNPAAYTASSGSLTMPYSVAHPYVEADLDAVRYTQSADVLYLCHPRYIPRTLSRTGADIFSLESFQFDDGPYADISTDGTTMSLSGGSYGIGDTVTVTSSEAFFDNVNDSDLGRMIRFRHGSVWDHGVITAIDSATEVSVYMLSAGAEAGEADDFRIGSWHGAIDHTIAGVTDLTNENTAYANYPSTVTFHQQRLWFANMPERTQRILASETADFVSFSPTQRSDNALLDTNGLDYTISTNEVNSIYWMRSSAKGLIIGTVGQEHILQSSSAFDPITPTNVKMEVQTAHGSRSVVRPVQVGSVVLFVHRIGDKLREFAFQFEADQYVSTDLSLLSEDLGKKKIKHITYQEEPSSIVWCVCDDGDMLAMTYQRDQDVVAWSLIAMEGANVLSAETTAETGDDSVWIITERTIDGNVVRYVEELQTQFNPGDDQNMAWFVDSGLSYDGRNATTDDFLKVTEIASGGYNEDASVTLTATGHTPFSGTSADVDDRYRLYIGDDFYDVQITAASSTTAATAKLLNDFPAAIRDTNTSSWAALVPAVTGLDHLEAESCSILADGGTHPDATVSGGSLSLQTHYATVVVGKGYTTTIRTLPIRVLQFPVDFRGKTSSPYALSIRVWNSLGGTFRAGTNRTYNIPYRVQSDPLGRPPRIQSGLFSDLITGADYTKEPQIEFVTKQPLPFTVLSATFEFDANSAI